MKKYLVKRPKDTVEVLILPNKDGSGYQYVNLTKGHICPCRFKTESEALRDMDKKISEGKVLYYEDVEDFCHNELHTYPQHDEAIEHFKHIEELEKENAELKKKCQDRCDECWEEHIKLTKAKEIIKEMLSILPKENIEGVYEITEYAEQFLKEGE